MSSSNLLAACQEKLDRVRERYERIVEINRGPTPEASRCVGRGDIFDDDSQSLMAVIVEELDAIEEILQGELAVLEAQLMYEVARSRMSSLRCGACRDEFTEAARLLYGSPTATAKAIFMWILAFDSALEGAHICGTVPDLIRDESGKLRPGPGPDIKVNGVTIPTVITEEGTQRFVPNRVVSRMVDAAGERKRYDLNQAWQDHGNGVYTTDEMRELYRQMGYSITGYAEVFNEDRTDNGKPDEIENPLWDEDEQEG